MKLGAMVADYGLDNYNSALQPGGSLQARYYHEKAE